MPTLKQKRVFVALSDAELLHESKHNPSKTMRRLAKTELRRRLAEASVRARLT